jgi:hypothetical protein
LQWRDGVIGVVRDHHSLTSRRMARYWARLMRRDPSKAAGFAEGHGAGGGEVVAVAFGGGAFQGGVRSAREVIARRQAWRESGSTERP